jgi:hypothetical protein
VLERQNQILERQNRLFEVILGGLDLAVPEKPASEEAQGAEGTISEVVYTDPGRQAAAEALQEMKNLSLDEAEQLIDEEMAKIAASRRAGGGFL